MRADGRGFPGPDQGDQLSRAGTRIAAAGVPSQPGPPREVIASALAAALALAVIAGVALLPLHEAPAPAPAPPTSGPGGPSAEHAYGELPLAFAPSDGRAAAGVDYVARAGGVTHLLGSRGATIALGQGAVRIGLLGASPAEPQALERLPGVVNELVGDDPARWRTGIPTFERVSYREVWPGVDVEWYGNRRRLEYDFIVAPAADPRLISLRFGGQDSLRLGANGDLLVDAGEHTIRQRAPVAYQPSASGRDPVPASYTLDGPRVQLRLGHYDRSRPLVIDPLVYLSIGPGPNDGAGPIVDNPIHDIAVDATGSAYVVGGASTSAWPTTAGAFDTTLGGGGGEDFFRDAFVTKLNPSGTAAVYSTFLGGGAVDNGSGIAVSGTGEALVTGSTDSSDFPATPGLDQTIDGRDAFVTQLNASGSDLVWSTFFGGSGSDSGSAILALSDGSAAIVGGSSSSNLPTTGDSDSGICDLEDADPDGGTTGDGFYAGFSDTGVRGCSTYLGGSAADSAADVDIGGGTIAMVGSTASNDFTSFGIPLQGYAGGGDAWLLKFSIFGGFSTYLGGDESETGAGVAVDSTNHVYVTGTTASDHDGGGGDFPTTEGAFQAQDPDPGSSDAFAAKFTNALSTANLTYSTYLGGALGTETGDGIAIDSNDAAYVAGTTFSSDFPTTPRALDTTPSGTGDVVLTKLNPAGSALSYSTFLSGGGQDGATGVAVSAGAAYVAGQTTQGLGQPVTAGTFDAPAGSFVAKVTTVAGPDVRCQGKSATRIGTGGGDRLIGTNGPDVFAGLAGNDRIVGQAGNDIACGGAGRDGIEGGPGKDRLNGEAGKDRLIGGGGRDVLKGAGGRDRCVGGGGRDRARGCERRGSI